MISSAAAAAAAPPVIFRIQARALVIRVVGGARRVLDLQGMRFCDIPIRDRLIVTLATT